MAQGGPTAALTSEFSYPDAAEPVVVTTRLVRANPGGQKLYNQYLRCERIGKGYHGEVYLCEDMQKGAREVAIKSVKRKDPREKMKMLRKNYQEGPIKLNSTENNIRKEIAVMKRCRHPNLVTLLEVIDDPRLDKIYLVMEYLSGGPVQWSTPDNGPLLTLAQTRRIMRDVILGVEFMHSKNLLHRDIKPSNLMYTEDRRSVKLIDFGVSHIIYPSAPNRRRNSEPDDPDKELFHPSDLLKRNGSPPFLAPEVVWSYDSDSDLVKPRSHDIAKSFSPSDTMVGNIVPTSEDRPPITKAIDIWALGITFYCLLFGHPPFLGVSDDDQNGYIYHQEFLLYHQICTQDFEIPEAMGREGIPTGGRSPNDRRSDGFLVIQLLDGMLLKDPKGRMSLTQVKKNPFTTRDVYNAKEWVRLTTPGASGAGPCWLMTAARRLSGVLSKSKT